MAWHCMGMGMGMAWRVLAACHSFPRVAHLCRRMHKLAIHVSSGARAMLHRMTHVATWHGVGGHAARSAAGDVPSHDDTRHGCRPDAQGSRVSAAEHYCAPTVAQRTTHSQRADGQRADNAPTHASVTGVIARRTRCDSGASCCRYMMNPIGGKMLLFLSGLPSLGNGRLAARSAPLVAVSVSWCNVRNRFTVGMARHGMAWHGMVCSIWPAVQV